MDRFGERLDKSLQLARVDYSVHAIGEGERSKDLRTVERLYGEMLRAHVTRNDAVVALGGGVVGDTAGFVAATQAPVVMMTGHPNEDVEKDALLLGAKALVAKPFEPGALEALLPKVVGG